MAEPQKGFLPEEDPELCRIVGEELRCLDRVTEHLAVRSGPKPSSSTSDYDAALVDLRDQIATARLEDIPPLIEQMERVQSLANWRRNTNGSGFVDPKSPYFAHLVLLEGERRREVLIGRSTYLDIDSGVRIVDWRDAPVSRLYYRYQEGDSYDEVFGEREVHGQITTRRSVNIVDAGLERVLSPQGSFARRASGLWQRLFLGAGKLGGGQGSALRPETHHRLRLGVGEIISGEDKHLREITALIDPRQFELITHPDSGLVVIQGGAGSGKTTIALHRLAYLAYVDPRRFRPDRMLVLVYNEALGRYVSLVLPALGTTGVSIQTYGQWAAELRSRHFPKLPEGYAEETPPEVARIKKHPGMLRAIDEWVADLETHLVHEIRQTFGAGERSQAAEPLFAAWESSVGSPTAHRLYALRSALARHAPSLAVDHRVTLERLCKRGLKSANDVVGAWADLLGNPGTLRRFVALEGTAGTPELERALADIARNSSDVSMALEEAYERETSSSTPASKYSPSRATDSDDPEEDDEEIHPEHGIDGRDLEQVVQLDREDDTLLLRLYQRLKGPLLQGGKGRDALIYEHLVVDEAQDLSPVEIMVALGTVSRAHSVTLAGDVAQRLDLYNGFTDWRSLFVDLGLDHVEIEPLKVSYRSTREIMEFAHAVLGPRAPADRPLVTRGGAPVAWLEFSHAGDSATFLAEALRELMLTEPRASVAVIARYPEQADLYHRALENSEVPRLRRIAEQDFPFRPGIDVTDVRQVKGLEFDYVILIEVSEASYPEDDEARYLLHIAATRAAHQLWVLTTGRPSRLLPRELMDRG